MTDLLLIALATWYVSFALASTHGPGGVFEWVREHVWHGRRGQTGTGVIYDPDTKGSKIIAPSEKLHNGLLDCPVCLAFWVALILLLVPMGVVVQALAVAGAAMLAHSASGWRFGNG